MFYDIYFPDAIIIVSIDVNNQHGENIYMYSTEQCMMS